MSGVVGDHPNCSAPLTTPVSLCSFGAEQQDANDVDGAGQRTATAPRQNISSVARWPNSQIESRGSERSDDCGECWLVGTLVVVVISGVRSMDVEHDQIVGVRTTAEVGTTSDVPTDVLEAFAAERQSHMPARVQRPNWWHGGA